MKQFKIVVLLLVVGILGCNRNSTFQNSVTFTGKVSYGHMDTTTSVLTKDGSAQGAVVTCNNYSDSAKAANDGSYSLNVQSVRTFSGVNSDSFTLQASWNGADETITVYGKPGDTISVREFILYKHTSTSAPRRIK
jgi:hypothetical protein